MMVKVIIAGSRSITDEATVFHYIGESKFEITEVVSGCANGVDSIGEKWADENSIPIKKFPADWKNLSKIPIKIKVGQFGKYNTLAGLNRNVDMANYADALIVIIKNNSSGSEHMLKTMEKLGKPTYVVRLN